MVKLLDFIRMIRQLARTKKMIHELSPEIELRPQPVSTLAEAVAAARSCYNDKIISSFEVTDDQKKRIGKQTFDSGHHTVFLHKMLSFNIIASRHVFHLLHYHPFYNTSQSSQRYVVFKEPEFMMPPDIVGEPKKLVIDLLKEIWEIYHSLSDDLIPIIKRLYPGKRKITNKAAEKMAIETARYILPIGAKSTAIYSIQLMTLLRLYRLAGKGAWGWELAQLLQKAVRMVLKQEPELQEYVPEPLDIRNSPEGAFITENGYELLKKNENRRKKLQEKLGDFSSKLIDFNKNMIDSLNNSSQLVSGQNVGFEECANPITNSHIIDRLHTDWLAPYSRVLSQGWVAFLKKLSYTANAQDQRHRTINSVTSLPELAETENPDYITPELIKIIPKIHKRYDDILKKIYETKTLLVKEFNIPVSSALYLTPNAHTIYIQQSGSLLGFRHKWVLRSCWRSQKEIWSLSMEEIKQVSQRWPELKPYLGPPCYVRYIPDLQRKTEKGKRTWIKPKCTEGKMFCDVPVWLNFTPDMRRIF